MGEPGLMPDTTDTAAAQGGARSIAQIDKAINDLRRKHRGDQDFRARETALFRERGFAQLDRDMREHQRAMAAARWAHSPRRKECPACGGSGYARAA